MTDSNTGTSYSAVCRRLESRALELDDYAGQTSSRIVRAVSQGQAEVLREFARELRGK